MNNIAFKRAKNSAYKGYFHDDFIVEYHPDPHDTYPRDQWEILAQDDFDLELMNNPELHIAFIEAQKQYKDSLERSAHDAEISRLQLAREEREELIKLRKYKRNQRSAK